MNNASGLFEPALDAVQFIDHRSITWSNIRQTDYWLHKRFQYTYPGPVHELRQRLLVVPPEQYGDQRLRAFAGRIVGAEGSESSAIDAFGNRVLSFYIPEVPFDVTFEVALKIERSGYPDLLPKVSAEQAAQFLAETSLTASDVRIAAQAPLAAQHPTAGLAAAITPGFQDDARWGVTHVAPTAAEALARGCARITRYWLACRIRPQLPARYISTTCSAGAARTPGRSSPLPPTWQPLAMPFDQPPPRCLAHHDRGGPRLPISRDSAASLPLPRPADQASAGLTRIEYAQCDTL
jgi:hypothetical protein